jgi:hypothetical protein
MAGISEVSHADPAVRPDGDPRDGRVLQADPQPRFRRQLSSIEPIKSWFLSVHKEIGTGRSLVTRGWFLKYNYVPELVKPDLSWVV